MNMEEGRNFDTLLSNLKDSNFDSLIDHLQLMRKGWTFYFLIDNDIIGDYCFPLGFNEDDTRRKINNEYLADQQVTLHALFYQKTPKKQTVFFDDYLIELRGLIKYARNELKNSDSLVNLQYERANNLLLTVDLDAKVKNFPNLIKDSFSAIITNVLLRIDGLTKLKNLLDSKKIIFESIDFDENIIEKACDIERGTDANKKIIKDIFLSLNKRLNSKEADSAAIDRILSINRYIQANGTEKTRKNVFLLTTGSPTNCKVMNLIKKGGQIHYPLIEGKEINFFRTTQEYFAYLICVEYYESGNLDYEKTIQNVRDLKEANSRIEKELGITENYIEKAGNIELSNRLLMDEKYQKIFKNYKKIRNSFENIGLFKTSKTIYESISKEINEKKFKDVKLIIDEIYTREKDTTLELDRIYGNKIEDLMNEIEFNGNFIRGIEAIKNKKSNFLISRASVDVVEGSYQHLPLFFKFYKLSPGYHDPVWRIIQLILEHNITDSNKVYDELSDLLYRLTNHQTHRVFPIEEKIIKVLLYLILPNTDLKSEKHSTLPDLKPQKWLKEIELRTENFGDLESEFLYMHCWVSRRSGDYNSSKQLALKGIAKFPEDPRFYHGHFLANYSIYLKSGSNGKFDLLNSILENVNLSYDKYRTFVESYYPVEVRKMVMACIDDCFNNNFCYFYTEQARLFFIDNAKSKAMDSLQKARIALEKLKLGTEFRQQFCEYYDTEANLEYTSSFFISNFDPKEKLQLANIAILRAIDLTENLKLKEDYDKDRKKILNRLNSI